MEAAALAAAVVAAAVDSAAVAVAAVVAAALETAVAVVGGEVCLAALGLLCRDFEPTDEDTFIVLFALHLWW